MKTEVVDKKDEVLKSLSQSRTRMLKASVGLSRYARFIDKEMIYMRRLLRRLNELQPPDHRRGREME